jgi:hypothetical protein
MHLLRHKSNDDFELITFDTNDLPPYAILSHTWTDGEEITYDELVAGADKSKTGFAKLLFCGERVAQDGLQYFWIDTCCIKRRDAAELSISLNSMFKWYRRAAKCYVYLSDVSTLKRKGGGDDFMQDTWEQGLRQSRWFTRGWTLQELLAPASVEFFTRDGKRLGDKRSLEQLLREITGIPGSALRGSPLSRFGIEQKFDWAKNRETTREEDWAYSLLGIFEVSMPALYDEGKTNAIKRLMEGIDRAASMHKECMRDLYVTDPRKDKARIEDTKGGLILDSYRWILENGNFKQWRNDPQSHLLWIKGDPGKGKTMLLCGIIDELSKTIAETQLLSFFYCQATDSRINSASAVLRGLLYLLIYRQPSLDSYIQEHHEHAGKSLFEDANTWVALSDIFTKVLQDPSLKCTYLIIDAVDECIVDLPKLLDFIIQTSLVSPHVKWLVSSRNWPVIEEQLDKARNKVRLCLELNEKSISAAVKIYIHHKVSQLAQQRKYDDKTRNAILNHLSSNANDTFLWVALVCQNLKNIPRWDIRAKLGSFPPGLDSLYERMMKQISDSEYSELCKRILALIATVYEPITLTELTSLIEKLQDMSNDIESLQEIIGFCGSFLTVRNDTIYFVHQSAKDYLLKKAYVQIFPSGGEEIHYEIFLRSIEVMSRTLRRDIYGLRAPGYAIERIERPKPDPLRTSRYSCIYWINHLCEWEPHNYAGAKVAVQDGGAVDVFMRTKYLYWLEALSLCRSMSEGVVSILKLQALLQVNRNPASTYNIC